MPSKPLLTDEEIRQQLKKMSAVASELNEMVLGLTRQLDERTQAQAQAPSSAKVQPLVTPKAETPVVEIRPTQPHGFMLPKNLSGSFNIARNLVEVQALPNYLRDDLKPNELADFRAVLGALAAKPAQRGNRDAMFPADLENFLPDDFQKGESDRRAFDVIEGKSAMGFNLAVLAAKTSENKPAHLYVLEDKLREKMIVAGPEGVKADFADELAKGGVQYVVKSDEKTASAINEFLAHGAKFRGEKGLLFPGNTQSLIEGLIKGAFALSEIPHKEANVKGTTLGDAIKDSKNPAIYTQITAYKRG